MVINHLLTGMILQVPGEMIQFDEHIFQMGGKKPPTRKGSLVELPYVQLGSINSTPMTFPFF